MDDRLPGPHAGRSGREPFRALDANSGNTASVALTTFLSPPVPRRPHRWALDAEPIGTCLGSLVHLVGVAVFEILSVQCSGATYGVPHLASVRIQFGQL